METVKIKSKLTSQNENKQTVPVRIFKITDIPDVMERKGWTVSARFMRKWFYDPFYEMTPKEKQNKVDMNTVDKNHIIEDLDFDWLLTSSLRIKPIYDTFVKQVSSVIEYNDYLGRKNKYHNSYLMVFVISLTDWMNQVFLLATK